MLNADRMKDDQYSLCSVNEEAQSLPVQSPSNYTSQRSLSFDYTDDVCFRKYFTLSIYFYLKTFYKKKIDFSEDNTDWLNRNQRKVISDGVNENQDAQALEVQASNDVQHNFFCKYFH